MNFEKQLYESGLIAQGCWDQLDDYAREAIQRFGELIVVGCIEKLETYRIPCGNSSSGELACEWTYDALKEIRDDIKETYNVSAN